MQQGEGPAVAAVRVPASFSVAFSNAPSQTRSFWLAWQTMMVVLLVVAGGPVWVWRVSALTP
jgi:hypothetical protein